MMLRIPTLIGLTASALVPSLQTRLMDVAGEAQTLAATLNHSALNIANAAGALLGGVVVSAGYGYLAPSVVGVMLAVAGIAVTVVALATARRQARISSRLGRVISPRAMRGCRGPAAT